MKGKGHRMNLMLTSVLFGGINGLGSKGHHAIREDDAVTSYPPARNGQRKTVGGWGLGGQTQRGWKTEELCGTQL